MSELNLPTGLLRLNLTIPNSFRMIKMARTRVMMMFLLSWVQPRHCSFYCPDHHRHVGRNILRLKELSGGVGHADHDHHQDQRGLDQNVTDKMPRPEFWTAQKLVRLNRGKFNQVPFYKDIYPRNQTEARLICPSGCLCKASDDDIEVKQNSFSVGTMSVCIHTTPRYWECQEKKNARLAPLMNLSSMTAPDYGKMCPNCWYRAN